MRRYFIMTTSRSTVRILLTTLMWIVSIWAFGQSQSQLDEFNIDRVNLTENGMLVLGSWALSNIVVSGYSATQAESSNRYFHQMNVYWNIVNLGIASYGYLSLGDGLGLDWATTLDEQNSIENILLINAGLDVLYVAGGWALMRRGQRSDSPSERYVGFGKSIMLQGAFLMAFDLGFYYVQANHGSELDTFNARVEQLQVSPMGFNVVLNLD